MKSVERRVTLDVSDASDFNGRKLEPDCKINWLAKWSGNERIR